MTETNQAELRHLKENAPNVTYVRSMNSDGSTPFTEHEDDLDCMEDDEIVAKYELVGFFQVQREQKLKRVR